jgi:predicted aminopeptidase
MEINEKIFRAVEYLYFQRRLSLWDTAKVVGVSHESIRRWLIKRGFNPRSLKKALKQKRRNQPNIVELRKEIKTLFGVNLPLEIRRGRKRKKAGL